MEKNQIKNKEVDKTTDNIFETAISTLSEILVAHIDEMEKEKKENLLKIIK
ncbi:MAG: hypothetical protein WCW03_01255 [Candidatus Paceibacterota bacterium]|jgi:hypothetical protein